MRAIVLLSPWESDARRVEQEAAMRAGLPTACHTSQVQFGETAVPRFSLEVYPEVFANLRARGAMPVNSEQQHGFVLDQTQWSVALGAMTGKVWTEPQQVTGAGPFEIRGTGGISIRVGREALASTFEATYRTRWKSGMPPLVIVERPSLFAWQPERLRTAIREMWQYIVFRGYIVQSRFIQRREVPRLGCPIGHSEPTDARRFAQRAVHAIGMRAAFYAFDIARCVDKTWTVTALHEAESSEPEDMGAFYATLAERIARG